MNYLSYDEVLIIHQTALSTSGGSDEIRDEGLLHSAIDQPRMTFGSVDLYPTLVKKVSALAYSLIQNHPFIDGNKRVGHAAMEIMLMRNGSEISADIDEQEQIVLRVAAGELSREEFTSWLQSHVVLMAV
jgi:death-on-curing protein